METLEKNYGTFHSPSKFAITVDAVLFGIESDVLKVLLIKRKLEPFKDHWALPGGFVLEGEDLEQAVTRELQEETGVDKVYLEQLYTYGTLDRDPRMRVITVAYYALVNLFDHPIMASSDASLAAWFAIDKTPLLAFDHAKILQDSISRLKGKVTYEPVGFELLPTKFTLYQLQRLYEIILQKPLDKRNFRKKILNMNLLTPLDEYEKEVSHRAARLYQFDQNRYVEMKDSGFYFDI